MSRRLRSVWARWTMPYSNVTDAQEQDASRMMAGLFLAVLVVAVPLLPVEIILSRFVPWVSVVVYYALAICGGLFGLYTLSRMGRPRLAARLSAPINTVLLLMAASAVGEYYGVQLMYFLLLLLFVSIMFTSLRDTLIVIPVQVAGMVVVGLTVDTISLEAVLFGPVVFYIIVGLLLLQYLYYYDLQERNRQRKLAFSEARYRAIVEDHSEMIARFQLDDRMTLTFANRAFSKAFGYDPDQGRDIGLRDVVSARHFEVLQTKFQQLTPANPEHVDVEMVEFRDGSRSWHYWHDRAFFDEAGQIIDLQSVGHDVTEEKRAREQAAELVRERERVLILQTLIGDVSHDLMTPLTVINANLHLIMKIEDRDRQTQYVDRAREQVIRLQRIIKDMLNMSRLDQATRDELGLVDTSLEALLTELVRGHQPVARLKRQTLVLGAGVPQVSVAVDPDRMQIALANLVDNAIKYTPERGKVRVSAGVHAGSVYIKVADNGVGIQPEDLPRVFERFYRSEAHRPTNSGSGLGLSIARKVIRLHGGEITVSSQPGNGTSFVVTLPLSHPAATPISPDVKSTP